ncbi:MAG: LPP20 family lipoprotein [Bacteriovoracaceae bacterium]|nr:LPP20 family lipoprotein [Bacteriovoracaceae bacterium]
MRFFWMILLFIGCSSSRYTAQKPPAWIYDPMSGCDKDDEICASAQGSSWEEADQKARLSLAQIFETNIKSTSQYGAFQKTDFSKQESYGEFIQEETNQVLKGVVIKERKSMGSVQEKVFYTLVALNKKQAAQEVQELILIQEKELDGFFNKRNAILKTRKSYTRLQELNARHAFLMGSPYPLKYDLPLLQKQQSKWQSQSFFMTLLPESNSKSMISQKIQDILSSLLTQSFFILNPADPKREKSFYMSFSQLDWQKKKINVEGFEKYELNLGVIFKNNQNENIGMIRYSHQMTGRSEKEIEFEMMKDVQEKIQQQFTELSFE